MKRIILFFILISTVLIYGQNDKSTERNIAITKGEVTIKMNKHNSSLIEYKSGNDTVSAYLSVPESKGKHPALIVIHEWWGLNEWVKKAADDFADSGYIALAIDLYRGKTATSPDEARELSGSVPQSRAAEDLKAAYNYLENMNDVNENKIGSVGWCMGGGYSLRAALLIPELSACVICYGRLVTDTTGLKKISCPVLGIFGENDKSITPDNVQSFEEALNNSNVKNKIIIYPEAGHAFMNQNNTGLYNESKSAEAWNEIYSFFNKNLKE